MSLRRAFPFVLAVAAIAPANALGWHQPASASPPISAADTAFYNAGASCYRQLEAKLRAAGRAYSRGRLAESARILNAARPLAERCLRTIRNFPTASPTAACVKPDVVRIFRFYRSAVAHFTAAVAARRAGRDAVAQRRIEAGLEAWGATASLLTRTDRQLRGQQACN